MRLCIHLINFFIIYGFIFSVQVFASTPVAQTDFSVISILDKYGPIAGIIGFFVYLTWLREQRLSIRINQLETYIQSEFVDIIKKMSETLHINTQMMHSTNETIKEFKNCATKMSEQNEGLIKTINSTPCLLVENMKNKFDIQHENDKIIITPK